MDDKVKRSENIPEGKQVEGPDPGSPAMEEIVREAEERGKRTAADRAEEEQRKQIEDGTETPG